jgi:hypothetical protein
MRTPLLASCAVAAVLALTSAASAQQPTPAQPPTAGTAGGIDKTPDRTRDDAVTGQTRMKSDDRAGPARDGSAPDATRPQPAQTQSSQSPSTQSQPTSSAPAQAKQSPAQDTTPSARRRQPDQDAAGATAGSRERQRNAGETQDRSQRSGRSGDDRRRSAAERGRDGRGDGAASRDTRTGETDRSRSETRTSGERQDRRQELREDARGPASASRDERVSERFSTGIERQSVRPLSRTDISVSIGASVPRSVTMYDVPRDVVTIYPQYRGHKFVVVENEIVIIEPRTRRVIATLPRAGSGRAAVAGSETTRTRSTGETTGVRESRLHLSDSQRQVIRTTVMREARCRLETRIDFVLLVPLPRTVEVCEFPNEVVSEVPDLRPYRFVVRGEEIAIVDPDEYEVVEVIE